MLEIHGNIVAADIGGHRNDGCVVELSDEMCGGDAVQVGHDDIHKNQVVLGASIELVHGFQSIQSAVNMALESVQEFSADTSTSLVIFHKQDLRLSDPTRIDCGALFATFGWRLDGRGRLVGRIEIRDVVDMAAVHRIDTVGVTDWVYNIVEVAI